MDLEGFLMVGAAFDRDTKKSRIRTFTSGLYGHRITPLNSMKEIP